ncbi:MAG: substrate-binding domain-containing protein [Rickettsiales bacterium]
MRKYLITLICLLNLGCSPPKENNIIRIVGSSTAFPYIIAVAEDFYRVNKDTNPVIEPTGTGMGFKLFCGQDQASAPSMIVASRKIKQSELDLCKSNGVTNVYESVFGYDGIIITTSQKNQLSNLTRKDLFLAMSNFKADSGKLVNNNISYWNEININLPKEQIIVYGPNASSGTREEINSLIMNYTCNKNPNIKKLYKDNKVSCSEIRTDKAFVDVGKNENLVITKIKQTGNALGITGYNYFIQNKQDIKAIKIDGIYPTRQNMISMEYSLTRPILIYYKKQPSPKGNIRTKKFLERLFSEFMVGYKGYLQTKGMIPISNEIINATRSKINEIFSDS